MRIVDVCAFYTPQGGGVRTYIEHKLRLGAEMGHEIVIVAPGAEDRIETRPGGGRIQWVASPQLPVDRRYRYFADAAAVHALLDREAPDLIEASSPWRTATIVAQWPGDARRSLIMHADPLAAYAYRWLDPIADRASIDRRFAWFWNHLRRAAARCDIVVSANEGLSRRLRMGGLPGVQTLPLGIDPGLFSPAHRDAAVRAELLARCNLGAEAMLLLAVGRHSPEKRWATVIDGCMRAGLEQAIGLVLIGDGRDHGRLRRRIGSNPHIHLLAPIRVRALLARVLASGDALIHGCEAETYGLVAAEAAGSGLPLIVPDEGGAADLATPKTAELYQAGNSGAAADAILRLAARDREELRAAARTQAARIPSIDVHFKRLFDAYAAILARRAVAA